MPRSIGWLIDWLLSPLIGGWSIDWLVDWLLSSLIGGGSIDWLTDLICCLFMKHVQIFYVIMPLLWVMILFLYCISILRTISGIDLFFTIFNFQVAFSRTIWYWRCRASRWRDSRSAMWCCGWSTVAVTAVPWCSNVSKPDILPRIWRNTWPADFPRGARTTNCRAPSAIISICAPCPVPRGSRKATRSTGRIIGSYPRKRFWTWKRMDIFWRAAYLAVRRKLIPVDWLIDWLVE